MIVFKLTGEHAAGAVLPFCGHACRADHQADPAAPAGRWHPTRLAVPWCTFCYRCGMSLAPRGSCPLCTADQPCPRWPRTAHAARFTRLVAARLGRPVPDELWTAAAGLADSIPDGRLVAELLVPPP